MTENEFRQYIERQTFRRAKTAVRNPHAYVIKGMNAIGTDEEYDEAAEFIDRNGFQLKLWGREYTVYYWKGHMYWTCGETLNRNDTCDYELTISPRKEYLYGGQRLV